MVRTLAFGVFIGLLLCAVEVAFAFTLQAFLTQAGVMAEQAARLPGPLAALGWRQVLALTFGLGAARSGLNWLQVYLQGAVHEGFRYRLRRRLLAWVFSGRSASTSQVMNLFNARAEAAGLSLANAQTLAIQATAALLIGLYLLALAPRLTLLLAGSLLVLLPPLRWADRRAKEAGGHVAGDWERTTHRLVVSIKNLLLIQIYGTQGQEEAAAQESLRKHRDHTLAFYRVTGFAVAAPQIVGLAMICLAMVWLGGQAVAAPGLWVTYFYLFLRLLQTFSTINQSFATVRGAWPQVAPLAEWWSRHGAEESAAPPAAAVAPTAPVGWRLSGVTYAYPDAPAPVLKDFDLRVEPGSVVVLTGASGSGKSTLLGVMLGGLKPEAGAVELWHDGEAPRPLSGTVGSVGYVGPESFLIEGTLRQNLLYGLRGSPSASELQEALDKAECGFVASLPKGLDHPLTEQGEGLSAGQKQRLGLARALLRKPKVLVLDEATANLDADTEAKLVATLEKLKGGMTIIAASHREALLRIADQHIRLGAA